MKLTNRLDLHETAIVDVLRRIMDLLDPPPTPPGPEKPMGFHATMKSPAKKPTRASEPKSPQPETPTPPCPAPNPSPALSIVTS
ncbi:MAG: hypothetical protein PSV13_19220 [Lacunisphaera sp.]|nr:hypothetical protein [Lacunisphaera sp.]